jgi:hypothetical protein
MLYFNNLIPGEAFNCFMAIYNYVVSRHLWLKQNNVSMKQQ